MGNRAKQVGQCDGHIVRLIQAPGAVARFKDSNTQLQHHGIQKYKTRHQGQVFLGLRQQH
jgi:hypothetical protein